MIDYKEVNRCAVLSERAKIEPRRKTARAPITSASWRRAQGARIVALLPTPPARPP